MRIIRGRYQRRQITAPTNLPVRPTTDMAKESLFNIIDNHFDLEETEAMDLFAGTGNISYELVSRGCPKVVAVDQDFGCVKFIRETANKLNMKELLVVRSDVYRFLDKHKMQYDLIFADPPYDCEHYDQIINLIFERNLLREGGMFVLEHDKYQKFEEHPHFMEQRHYGKVNFTFFAQTIEEEDSEE